MREPAQLFRPFLFPPPAFPHLPYIFTASRFMAAGHGFRSRASLELDQLRDRGGRFDEAWRALVGCELEQALRLLPVLGQKRQLTAVEIGLAGLRGFGLRIGVE